MGTLKEFVLFDDDGVLVDTERWYVRAGERALADVGFVQDEAQYLRDMSLGQATWAQARAAGIDDRTIDALRRARDHYYQGYLRTEAIEIGGVLDVLAALSRSVRMAVVTTSRRADFEAIHEHRDKPLSINKLFQIVSTLCSSWWRQLVRSTMPCGLSSDVTPPPSGSGCRYT